MRFPDGKAKALTLSYDDGVEQDIRLIELMTKYGIKGTFNINSGLYAPEGTVYPAGQVHRRLSKQQCTALYSNPLVEVAVHAVTHPFLETLPASLVMQEIVQDRVNLEDQFGTIVRGMAYPYGTYNDTVVQVAEQAGIAYSRTVHSHHRFDVPTDWLRMGATCHHNDAELMTLARRFLNDTPDRAPYLFYLWGHSYEFESADNWHVIEEFLQVMGGRQDVWYATNIEIYDYVQAYQRLQYSADGTRVYNPSTVTVWVTYNSKTVEIPTGQCVQLAS